MYKGGIEIINEIDLTLYLDTDVVVSDLTSDDKFAKSPVLLKGMIWKIEDLYDNHISPEIGKIYYCRRQNLIGQKQRLKINKGFMQSLYTEGIIKPIK